MSLALRYQPGQSLEILDQTLLPHQEVWRSGLDPEDMIEHIRTLRVRGAPLIGVAAALALGELATRSGITLPMWQGAAGRLRAARPTAVNLMWAIDRMLKAVQEGGLQVAAAEAQDIYAEDVALCERIASAGHDLFVSQDQVLTHCNTGALATAGRGTALGILQKVFESGREIHVWVDETRPLLQGARLTAWELKRLGIPHTLICDNMAASLMAAGRVTKVIVGADRIAANGDFANKVGTYSLAVLAKHHRIPFFVAAPFSTVDIKCGSGREIPIEEREPSEVRRDWSPQGVPVWNPAFDVTPASLVTGWILDCGVFSLDEVSRGALRG